MRPCPLLNSCGRCRNCLEGHKENCRDAKGVGVNRNGAFAEYLVIPSSNVWSCRPNIPEELYAIFDPFGNATHTVRSYRVLAEEYPQLPLEVLLPDDRFRRIGQSVAAASLPQVRP